MEIKELDLEPVLIWDMADPSSDPTIVPQGPALKGFLLSEMCRLHGLKLY